MAAIEMKEKNRASKESNQLTVVAEGIPALGWVMLVRGRRESSDMLDGD